MAGPRGRASHTARIAGVGSVLLGVAEVVITGPTVRDVVVVVITATAAFMTLTVVGVAFLRSPTLTDNAVKLITSMRYPWRGDPPAEGLGQGPPDPVPDGPEDPEPLDETGT